MSGGVDSSVAAALLVEQGYDVHGVSLRMWEGERGPRVCSDHRGAKEVAEHLGIPHTLLDFRGQFAETVVKPLLRIISHGRTPNPCVACNRDFKLGTLLQLGQGAGRRITSPPGIMRESFTTTNAPHVTCCAARMAPRISLIFCLLCRKSSWRTRLFPLGEMQKSAVRAKARALNLPAAERPESQDICFGDYKALVASYAKESELDGGDVVDRSGKLLGRHDGIHGVTVGQRRGLGISATRTALCRRDR